MQKVLIDEQFSADYGIKEVPDIFFCEKDTLNVKFFSKTLADCKIDRKECNDSKTFKYFFYIKDVLYGFNEMTELITEDWSKFDIYLRTWARKRSDGTDTPVCFRIINPTFLKANLLQLKANGDSSRMDIFFSSEYFYTIKSEECPLIEMDLSPENLLNGDDKGRIIIPDKDYFKREEIN